MFNREPAALWPTALEVRTVLKAAMGIVSTFPEIPRCPLPGLPLKENRVATKPPGQVANVVPTETTDAPPPKRRPLLTLRTKVK